MPSTHQAARSGGSAAATVLLALSLAVPLAACKRGPTEAELVASAKALIQKKDAKAAVLQLKSALQQSGDSPEIRLLLGKTLLDAGDPASALVELRKAQELQIPDERVIPDIARAMLLVGEESKLITQYGELKLKDDHAAAELMTALAAAYAAQGDSEKARSSVDEALALKPGHPPAMMVLARLEAVAGKMDAAIALLDKVLAAEPANERAGVLKGEMLLQGKRDIDGALAAYAAVLKAKPDSVAARAASANILFQQKKIDEARTAFEALKKTAPTHPETLFLEAQFAFLDKNYARTRELGDQLLKGVPDNVRVLELTGAAEYRLKNYLQAEALLGRALKLAPRQLMTRQMLAQTFLREGQPGKTIEVLKPLLESKDADGTSLAIAGEAYLQMGDGKRSDEAFQRALKASPKDDRVRTTAAMAQLARGSNPAAVADLESIAGGDSGPRADLALISARLRDKDYNGALKAIERLEKKMPDQALPLQLRGRVLTMKDDLAGATKAYEAALAKEPAYFPAIAALAALDLAAKKPEAARARFEAHLKAQPKSWQAKLALAELEARVGAPADKVNALLREAVKLNPIEPRTHLVLVNNLINAGDGKAALLAAQDATASLPNNLEVLDAQGRAEMAAGDQQRAVSTFKKLASLQPTNPMHELRLAEAYMALKDSTAAAAALKRAATIQPDLLQARRGQIMVAMANQRPQDALAVARDMQTLKPKDPTGWVAEGEIESTRKNWDQAAAAYRAALQRNKAADTSAKLYAALQSGGKAAEAEKVAAEWTREHPKDTSFQYFLGDLALARKDYGDAEARYRKVLEIQPDNALALNNVAWLLVQQNKPGAVQAAERANKLMPDRAPLLDTLSIALEAENQLPQAIDVQKRAIAAEPRDGNLTLRLAKLYIKAGDKPRARAELEALGKLGEKFPAQAEVGTLLKTL
jgi:putative PEP-CTERM system TPR-repeat lipoprotein